MRGKKSTTKRTCIQFTMFTILENTETFVKLAKTELIE